MQSARTRSADGFTLPELLGVLVFLALVSLIALGSFSKRSSRLQATESARMMKTAVQRARMDAIYSGLNHFVVLDEDQRQIQIFADNGPTSGEFDAGDQPIFTQRWGKGVQLAIPAGQSSVSNPLGGSAITTGWSLPAPDSSARWGTDLIGFTLTPRGTVQSASTTPTTISSGTVVFSSPQKRVSALMLRGRLGTVDAFELVGDSWKKM